MLRIQFRLALSVVPLASIGLAQTTERISVSSAGMQADGQSGLGGISADGRFVAFGSAATNLVPGDTNGTTDIFLRDRLLNTTERLSVSTGGTQADANCGGSSAMLSTEGRFVVFSTSATNLVASAPVGSHVYLRDRLTATTEPLDLSTSGQVLAGQSYSPNISADGRFVCFANYTTLGGNVTHYIRDRISLTTTAVLPTPCNLAPGTPLISQDGRFLALDDCPQQSSIVGANLRDRQTLQTWAPSTGQFGSVASHAFSLSSDGRIMVYGQGISSGGYGQVFVFDRVATAVELISRSWDQSPLDGYFNDSSASANGRFVTFTSSASNLVLGDLNNKWDVFLTDRSTHTTALVSIGSDGSQADDHAAYSRVSDDGRIVVFTSAASNLVLNDTNGVVDIFVRDFGYSAPSTYCSAKVNSHGCLPTMGWTGTPRLSGPDDFHVTASSMVNASPGIMFWGTAPDSVPFVGGLRCVGSPIIRMPVQFSGGTPFPAQDCSGTYDIPFSHSYMASFFLGAGSTVHAQFWQRDSGHPDGTGQGLSGGLQFTIAP